MSRPDTNRLDDILTALDNIKEILAGVSLHQFLDDVTIHSAVLFQLIVIGEAAANTSSIVQQQYPHVSWRKIKKLRNVVVHEYFALEGKLVWNVVVKDLPILETQIKNILEQDKDS